MITITADHLDQLKTPQGGYNKCSMEIIGAWPLASGWKERMIGTRISDRNWHRALQATKEIRHYHRGNTRSAR